MAREKGMGNLQREKSGRWTLRVGIKGKRYSRSTGTRDRQQAERYLERFLSPLGLGRKRIPLSDVWLSYLKSPCRRDLSKSTLAAKRNVWRHFARWMEKNYLHVDTLAGITREMIAAYLACISDEVCASTYNSRICVLREIFHCLVDDVCPDADPWTGVRLRSDDCHSRRELSIDELSRLLRAAAKEGDEWHRLFLVGIYTGLRLGDCCRLEWNAVNLERRVVQLVPQKTKKHANGHFVTIPIHEDLFRDLNRPHESSDRHVMPMLAKHYEGSKWHVTHGLQKIFRAANIQTSIRLEGRRTRTPEATFHSLRHTFVSFAANAGVSLSVIASIVGHESTAMTRHYYHENEDALRRAVDAIPSVGVGTSGVPLPMRSGRTAHGLACGTSARLRACGIPARLRQLDRLFSKGAISADEFKSHRARILGEI